MEFLSEYGLFLAKTITFVLALLFVVVVLAANASRAKHEGKHKGDIVVTRVNDELDDLKEDMRLEILPIAALKEEVKAEKKKKKAEKKEAKKSKKNNTVAAVEDKARVFVLDFDGDPKATQVEDLRQTITAVLSMARPEKDEVMLKLESPGGMVHAYGLASSQLSRLRKHNIPLTICVDKVAASGGYMMACVANHLIAAPFAYIGSIGVVLQLPNIHRLLKDNKVDYEMITAGEYKRTLTTFGENTDKGRAKVQEEVEEMHDLFKDFIQENRPGMDLGVIATGEVWTGAQALGKGLIDAVDTSDEWVVEKCKTADVFQVAWEQKKPLKDKLASMLEGSLASALDSTLLRWLHRADKEKYFS